MPEHSAPWVEPVRQRLRAWRTGQLLLDTCRAHLYTSPLTEPRRDSRGQLPAPAPARPCSGSWHSSSSPSPASPRDTMMGRPAPRARTALSSRASNGPPGTSSSSFPPTGSASWPPPARRCRSRRTAAPSAQWAAFPVADPGEWRALLRPRSPGLRRRLKPAGPPPPRPPALRHPPRLRTTNPPRTLSSPGFADTLTSLLALLSGASPPGVSRARSEKSKLSSRTGAADSLRLAALPILRPRPGCARGRSGQARPRRRARAGLAPLG